MPIEHSMKPRIPGAESATGDQPITEVVMNHALRSLIIAGAISVPATLANAQDVDWAKVDAAIGRMAAR